MALSKPNGEGRRVYDPGGRVSAYFPCRMTSYLPFSNGLSGLVMARTALTFPRCGGSPNFPEFSRFLVCLGFSSSLFLIPGMDELLSLFSFTALRSFFPDSLNLFTPTLLTLGSLKINIRPENSHFCQRLRLEIYLYSDFFAWNLYSQDDLQTSIIFVFEQNMIHGKFHLR